MRSRALAAIGLAVGCLAATGQTVAATASPGTTGKSVLVSVSAVNADDVWAVGYRLDRSPGFKAITQHWDGSSWDDVALPSVHGRTGLSGVDALSTDDVWAVGSSTDTGGNTKTLVEHWDGSQWNRVRSANPAGGDQPTLRSVSAVSPDDIWAVGRYQSDSGYETLAEHWDGTRWAIENGPSIRGTDYLDGVSAISADDVWAVGSFTTTGGDSTLTTLIEHWNGTGWTRVPAPSPGRGQYGNELTSLDAVSPDDVWAVGSYSKADEPHSQSILVEHWDGRDWQRVPAPQPDGLDDTILTSVSAAVADDVWAVGTSTKSGKPTASFTEHWDGTSWSQVSIDADEAQLAGVTAISAGDVWAVGSVRKLPGRYHWNGSAWARV